MSSFPRLCASTSVFAVLAAVTAQAQPLGSSLQPEYVIVTADRARNADPAAADVEVTAAKA